MKFSDETLMAYADGELDVATRAAIEAGMASDPQIAQAVERHRSMRRDLRAAFDPLLDEVVPERLVTAARMAPVRDSSDVVPIDRARRRTPLNWSWPHWSAMAASLLIGILITRVLTDGDEDIVARQGHMVAAGSLATALDHQPSGVTGTSGVHVSLTYRTKAGEFCRTFTMSAPAALAGIACRQGDEWRLDTLVGTEGAEAGSNYRMARTAMPPSILQTVQDSIEGDALDASQESALRERNWRH